MNSILGGKVSLKVFQIGVPIGFTQKESRYIPSAIFDGVSEKNEGLEVKFIFPWFSDNRSKLY